MGSNSVSFLVAETRGEQGRFRVLWERSILTRLAEHLIDTAVPQAKGHGANAHDSARKTGGSARDGRERLQCIPLEAAG